MKHPLKSKLLSLMLGLMLAFPLMGVKPAKAQTDPYLGQLMLVGYNFCPRSWVAADGQLLPVSQYSALFSLYGTTFGGDGRTTFGIPDLRGRAPIHTGHGPGLANYLLGSRGGAEGFTLTESQMPSHNHSAEATNDVADKNGPGTDILGVPTDPLLNIYSDAVPDRTMDPRMIGDTGGNQAVAKRSPYLTMRWCVALQGVFPSRS
ncbi:MAG: phage tail protein [Rhodobacteraceae bacterium]|nr:phage tail protein [Paracoccaceae bacterium]